MQVRLANGPHSCEGRVELNQNGTWVSVGDSGWGLKEAKVICRQLGCGEALSAPTGNQYGNSVGPAFLNEVQCTGEEASVTECYAAPTGPHKCICNSYAGAVCSFPVRLSGGPSLCAGRVELFHQGEWGTVCDDSWDLQDAAVVCRELDCGAALSAPHGAWFGEGPGPIWLNEVRCMGTEEYLHSCPHIGFRKHVCTHEEDLGCKMGEPHAPLWGTPALRLVGGRSRCSGRLEVFHEGEWGTVCDDMWDLLDVAVVCRELDCGEALAAPGRAFFGEGSSVIWLDDVQCQGEESMLSECHTSLWGTTNCRHSEDWQVRLQGGPGSCAGRVEVLYQDYWGTVCDDGWDLVDAAVVCRELGCGAPLLSPGNARYGPGSGPIWLDDVNCTGAEFTLQNCRSQPWGTHNCNHHEDASVICTGREQLNLPADSHCTCYNH
uniref:Soluble scavenger receptor cysteine-rich domain-containing protein SSC5D n=1 Tax=Podarcis muralis TaxID=64176 RepID=A0A670JGM6_PODMU